LAVFALVVAACGDGDAADTTEAAPATTEAAPDTTEPAPEPTTTEAVAAIGSEQNPIQVLFVPSTDADDIISGGEVLKEILEAETGLFFEVSVPTSYGAVVEEMCASPDNTIGFIPAQAYVIASDLCGVVPVLKAVRFGYDVYWTQFIVPRDSDIQTLEDLNGKTWAYPEVTSTSGFLVPQGLFNNLGIVPADSFEAGGHTATALAIYNGEADFGTTFFSPAIDASRTPIWDGDPANADVPADLLAGCGLNADGALFCGDDYEVRDARRNIREENPDVVQQVRIIDLTDEIPNDTMSFSPDFDATLRDLIVAALVAFAENDPDQFEVAFDAYSWTGVTETSDSEFDSIREALGSLGLGPDDLG
jgi:phosphonate transport system substrate-binding protein